MKILQKCRYWDKHAHEGLLQLELEGEELEQFLSLDADEKDEYLLENAELIRDSEDENSTINIINCLFPIKYEKEDNSQS